MYARFSRRDRFQRNRAYGTLKTTLLESVPLGVTTWTVPVVAPVGTAVVINAAETTVNVAAVPLKVMLVASVRSVPRILPAAPTLPEAGRVLTNGPRPTDRLKIVPSLLAPPLQAVPYRSPLVAWTSPAKGSHPSVQFGKLPCEQKLYRVVSAPIRVILKAVPWPWAPAVPVVP
jgi:hypothetical protein